MDIYLDSSALVRRAVDEVASEGLRQYLKAQNEAGARLSCSDVGVVELSRALQARAARAGIEFETELVTTALTGVQLLPLDEGVVERAQRLRPAILRSLDAIHCATALLAGVDVVVTYDAHLADAAHRNGLTIGSPGT